MFSARTRWDRTVNRLARAVEERRRSGGRLLDLTGSNPTRAAIPYPPDLLAPLGSAAGLRYDPEPRGLARTREAVAADFAGRGVSVGADRLLLTASTSEGYALLFKLLCDPGDSVLVPRPGYPLFDYLAGLESVRLEHYPLEYDGGWSIDVTAVERALRPDTRAIVIISPNNPTGSFTKREEAARLRALCAERGLALVSDEVFADYPFGDDPRRAGSLAEDGACLAFALGGLSKSCGLPQLKLAWLAVSGPTELREEALARLEIAADAFLSVAPPVQHAAPALLARAPELRAPIRQRVLQNRRALVAALDAGSPASVLDAEGGWYAVLRVPATMPDEERATRLVLDDGVLVHPGYLFEFPREAHLVVSLLTPPRDFSEGIGLLLARLVL